MAYDQVKAIRREATPSRGGFEGFMAWAKDHYTWARYTREGNHLPKPMAKALLTLLLMRDVGKDSELGLLGNTPTPLEDAEALPGIKLLDYLVGWQRLAALLGFLQHLDSVESDQQDAGAREQLLSEIRARGIGRQLDRQIEPLLALQKILSGSDLPEAQSAAVMVPTLNPMRNVFEQTHLLDPYERVGKET
jgi:hypothetical protein